MLVGERILPRQLSEIKPNHRARYEWAAHFCQPGMRVLDAAAGVGYGSYILASKGCYVDAVDLEPEAEAFHNHYWKHPNVEFTTGDILEIDGKWDAIVSLETIEHIEEPEKWRELWNAPILIASVPNQDVVPFSKESHKFHERHYTKDEFEEFLNEAGWKVQSWWTQYGKWEKFQMIPGTGGMTLGVVCERL